MKTESHCANGPALLLKKWRRSPSEIVKLRGIVIYVYCRILQIIEEHRTPVRFVKL